MRVSKADQEQAKQELAAMLKPGDTIHTTVRHVSQSGMLREIDCLIIRDNDARHINYHVSRLLELRIGKHEGVCISGCGSDMGFEIVYNVGRVLFPGGFACLGEHCPASDHANGDRDYTPGRWHETDGGYALRQRWL